MNVSGPTAGLAGIYRPAAPRSVSAPSASRAAADVAPDSATAESAAADIPAGSDPALWAVLTTEERAFFQRQTAMGPVTYGPARQRAAASTADAPLGQRIDCRA